jgi:hypothetical protein
MEVKMISSGIKSANCKAIAYRLRQGQDNDGVDRESLALFLEGVSEYIEAADKEISELGGLLGAKYMLVQSLRSEKVHLIDIVGALVNQEPFVDEVETIEAATRAIEGGEPIYRSRADTRLLHQELRQQIENGVKAVFEYVTAPSEHNHDINTPGTATFRCARCSAFHRLRDWANSASQSLEDNQ